MNATFNPHGKPVHELPAIYGFNNGGSRGDVFGQLLAADGEPLGGHICSHEYYMRRDLGIEEGSRPDRHEHFRAHYPDGYRMEFVSLGDVMTHAGLTAAFAANAAKRPAQGMSTEGENSRSEVEGKACQPGPKDAPEPFRRHTSKGI